MAKFLDRLDKYESQFLVLAILQCRTGELFTNVVNFILLSIVIVLDKNTSGDTM